MNTTFLFKQKKWMWLLLGDFFQNHVTVSKLRKLFYKMWHYLKLTSGYAFVLVIATILYFSWCKCKMWSMKYQKSVHLRFQVFCIRVPYVQVLLTLVKSKIMHQRLEHSMWISNNIQAASFYLETFVQIWADDQYPFIIQKQYLH